MLVEMSAIVSAKFCRDCDQTRAKHERPRDPCSTGRHHWETMGTVTVALMPGGELGPDKHRWVWWRS